MIEVRKETIFQKLKTEIIPLPKDRFFDYIYEIMMRIDEGDDSTIPICILSECFKDDHLIDNLVNDGFCEGWHEKTIEVYNQLVTKRQKEFKKSINKKFESRNEVMKDMDFDKTEYELIEAQVNIKDIIIPERFKETPPSGYKIRKIYDHYKKFGIFPAKVILDETNSLISGYPVILVCKMVDKTDLLCYNMVRKSL